MLAMVVNDNAFCLDERVALWFFASMLAPTTLWPMCAIFCTLSRAGAA